VLAILVASETAINSAFLEVGGLDVAAEVAAINLGFLPSPPTTRPRISGRASRTRWREPRLPASFFLACLAALELEELVLEEI
jgi:hypothetical protein